MTTRKASCNCGQLSVTYEGPDPERISVCQCNERQKRTGSVLSRDRLPAVSAVRPSTRKARRSGPLVPSATARHRHRRRIAGAGFEPATFGL